MDTRAKGGCTRLTSCIYSSAGPFVNTACCFFFCVPPWEKGTIDHCTVCCFNVIRHIFIIALAIVTAYHYHVSRGTCKSYLLHDSLPASLQCQQRRLHCQGRKTIPVFSLVQSNSGNKTQPGFHNYKPAFLNFEITSLAPTPTAQPVVVLANCFSTSLCPLVVFNA